MQHFKLSPTELIQLRVAHRKQKEKWAADRIKAISALGSGRTLQEVADILLLDTETLRAWVSLYRKGKLSALCERHYLGKAPLLTVKQQNELRRHCEYHSYFQAAQVKRYIFTKYDINFSLSAVVNLLHKLGFSYRKPSLVPARLSGPDTVSYLGAYEALRKTQAPVYFIDACHPQHQTRLGYGWFKKGQESVVVNQPKPNKINIHGAVHLQTKKLKVRFEDALNGETAKNLLIDIYKAHPKDERVFIIGDNAGYYHSRVVKDWLHSQKKIIFVYLPPYCPHFNLIERVWKYFHRRVTHNHFYPEWQEFSKACTQFFQQDHRAALTTLLTENFHLWPLKGKLVKPDFDFI